MKFLAWFFAILVFLSSFYVLFVFNSHQLFLTPVKTKEVLEKTDFYGQAKSVIKKDLFEASYENPDEISQASKQIGGVLDDMDFQGKIEVLISDFYAGLKSKKDFVLSVSLKDFKVKFIQRISAETSDVSIAEIETAIPDVWKIDTVSINRPLSALAFMYNNYYLIILIYLTMAILFLAICLANSFKWLRLFFWVFLLIGILVLLQRLVWNFLPETLFSSITNQGRSGLEVLMSNFIKYFKSESNRLLLIESLSLIIPSILGLIIVSLVPEKVHDVPLSQIK